MAFSPAVLREHCRALYRAGVIAADPYLAVGKCLSSTASGLSIRLDPADSAAERVGHWSKIHLIAFGKAACAMAKAAQTAIPAHRLAGKGLAVTTYDNVSDVDDIEVIGAGHPLPDSNGLQAAGKIVSRLQAAEQNQLVLALISGGGSALLPSPVEGISLADKIATTQLLLSCGADIRQINCVRKHLSTLKGGGLTRLAAPADVHALILSDVLGDDLSAIASGPTVADGSTFTDAIDIFRHYGLWGNVPPSVGHYLQQGAAGLQPETAKSSDPVFQSAGHTLIGSNAISVDAIINAATQLNYHAELYSAQLCGEARQAAEQLALHCKDLLDQGLAAAQAVIAGGETTVTLTGTGKGGRNQEMALAFALTAERIGLNGYWTFLSAGTDGRDGPTDAAGAIVDGNTADKIRRAGIDPHAALANNDSYTALQAANDLLITGATGTNVADLQIVLLHPFTE